MIHGEPYSFEHDAGLASERFDEKKIFFLNTLDAYNRAEFEQLELLPPGVLDPLELLPPGVLDQLELLPPGDSATTNTLLETLCARIVNTVAICQRSRRTMPQRSTATGEHLLCISVVPNRSPSKPSRYAGAVKMHDANVTVR
jgi:hypothetical protein